jgi:putative FmdB family regulatory protein
MPIYDYACDKCHHEFEVEQRITDDPVKTCPACRSRKVKRLISKTSFVLKGGGWYSDLYSSSDAKKPAKKDGDASEKPGSDKGESKSDDKGKQPADKGGSSGSGGGKAKGKGKGSKAAA